MDDNIERELAIRNMSRIIRKAISFLDQWITEVDEYDLDMNRIEELIEILEDRHG